MTSRRPHIRAGDTVVLYGGAKETGIVRFVLSDLIPRPIELYMHGTGEIRRVSRSRIRQVVWQDPEPDQDVTIPEEPRPTPAIDWASLYDKASKEPI